MADEELAWQLKFDLTGSGLQQAATGLSTVEGQLAKGQKGVASFESAFTGMATAVKGAMAGLTVAVGVAVEGLRKLNELGTYANQAFGERASSIRAYTSLLGDATEAQREYSKAQAVAFKTPFLSTKFEAAQQQLMVAGFRNEGGKSGGSLDRSLMAVADLSSLMGDKNQALQSGSHAMSEIMTRGHLGERQLQMLSQDVGLNIKMVYEELGKAMGGKSNKAIEKLISHGGISSEWGAWAVEKATMRQLNEKRLGDTATAGGGSLTTLLVNQGEQWKNAFKAFDSEDLRGVQIYKRALQEQGEMFDLATKKGQAMSIMLQDFSDKSDAMKGAWTDVETSFLESFSKGYRGELDKIGVGAEADIAPLRSLAVELGKIGPVVADALHAIIPAIAKAAEVTYDVTKGLADRAGQMYGQVGKSLSSGRLWEVTPEILSDNYYMQRDLRNGKIVQNAKNERERLALDKQREDEHEKLAIEFDTATGDSAKGGGALKIGEEYKITQKAKAEAAAGGRFEHFGDTLDYLWAGGGKLGPLVSSAHEAQRAEQEAQADLRLRDAEWQREKQALQFEADCNITIEGAGKNAGQIVGEIESHFADRLTELVLRRIPRFLNTPSPRAG